MNALSVELEWFFKLCWLFWTGLKEVEVAARFFFGEVEASEVFNEIISIIHYNRRPSCHVQ